MSENNIKYRRQADDLLSVLKVTDSPKIGAWGGRRRNYLREHQHAVYIGMLFSGKPNAYLEKINRQTEAMLFQSIKQFSAVHGVTERLKQKSDALGAPHE